jgi:hypothetical protein
VLLQRVGGVRDRREQLPGDRPPREEVAVGGAEFAHAHEHLVLPEFQFRHRASCRTLGEPPKYGGVDVLHRLVQD